MSTPPTIRTLIVDDEPAARGALRSLLKDESDIRIVGEVEDGASALASLRTGGVDLLFLDVQMPEMDGFTLLRRLDPQLMPVVIFVTAFDQYALRAFETEAMDYLLKPFSDERFQQALGRARREIRHGRIGTIRDQLIKLLNRTTPRDEPETYRTRLVIRQDGRMTVIPVADVDWLEADGDTVKVHASRRSAYLLRETMKDLEAQLDPAQFIRIHRSTIINVDRMKELQPYFKGDYVVILSDGTRLKLSRRFKDRLEVVLGRGL